MYGSGSPFREYKPLQPIREMTRSEFCWCASGKKWKKCHAIREHQVKLPLPVIQSKFYSEAKATGICFHPDAPERCSGAAIRAHTIQKRTGLLEIAEDGHVLSGRNSDSRSNADELQLIGINSASTFRGFCSFHDTTTFRAAEIVNNPTKLAAFLLSYRALCYEIYMKQVALATLRFLRDNLDAGRSFDEQAEIQQRLNAAIFSMQLGFDEHSKLKVAWDETLKSNNLANFQWSYTKFDTVLPVATSGVYFPEQDFAGNALQPLTAPVGTLALMGFNVIPIAGKTSVIFGWLDNKPQNSQLIESFNRIPSDLLASAVIQFCFDTSDNIFVRPSWWAEAPEVPKNYLIWNLRNSLPGNKQADALVPKSPALLESIVLNRKTEFNI